MRVRANLRYYIVAAVAAVLAASLIMEARTPKVAVLNISGVILSADTYLEAVREIEKDGSFKALVVRVDSPGGSVAASQEIHALIRRMSGKMPTVASMGNTAASGGYYVACGAPVILANPGTVTGSIGVIATFANYSELLRWAKMDFEVVKTGDLKDAGSPLRSLTERERKYLQDIMDGALRQFEEAVANSRSMEPARLKAVLDGRVILGSEAVEAGLVDAIGTLSSAIEMAAEKAGISPDSPVQNFPERHFGFYDLISSLRSGGSPVSALAERILSPSGLYYMSGTAAAGKIF